MTEITVLYANLFSVMRAIQKYFRVTSEGEAQILKKISTKIRSGEKMANKAGELFLLTTKLYKSANNANFLAPSKRKPYRKEAVQPIGTAVKKQ